MRAVNQLSNGYEPCGSTQVSGVTPDKPDEDLIPLHFAKPAVSDRECRNLIWAIYWKVRREASATRRKIWPDIVQNYNCRVVRGRRITQNDAKKAIAQMRQGTKNQSSLEVTEEKRTSANLLATPPRPCTWADLGRSKSDVYTLTDAQVVQKAQLCNVLRAVALKRVRDALSSVICAGKHTSVADYTPWKPVVTVNALTGTLRTTKRRAFVIPRGQNAVTYEDWPRPAPLVLTSETVLVGSPSTLAFYDYNSELNSWLRSQADNTLARPRCVVSVASNDPQEPWVETQDDEADPFGFGGGLD